MLNFCGLRLKLNSSYVKHNRAEESMPEGKAGKRGESLSSAVCCLNQLSAHTFVDLQVTLHSWYFTVASTAASSCHSHLLKTSFQL